MPDLVAAVAEPNRRRLLQLLGHGEQTVTVLASHFTVSRSAILQHLGVLAGAGLVESRRVGRFQRYRLKPGHVLDVARTIITPEVRGGSGFADPVQIGPDAHVLDRLIAFTDRAV